MVTVADAGEMRPPPFREGELRRLPWRDELGLLIYKFTGKFCAWDHGTEPISVAEDYYLRRFHPYVTPKKMFSNEGPEL